MSPSIFRVGVAVHSNHNLARRISRSFPAAFVTSRFAWQGLPVPEDASNLRSAFDGVKAKTEGLLHCITSESMPRSLRHEFDLSLGRGFHGSPAVE
jgi:hypothetical protein